MKTCGTCQIEKDDSEFYKNKGKLHSECKLCSKIRSNQYYNNNKEKINQNPKNKEYAKQYYKDNKEELNQQIKLKIKIG